MDLSEKDPEVLRAAVRWLTEQADPEQVEKLLRTFTERFPNTTVYHGEMTAAEWLAKATEGMPNREAAVEELRAAEAAEAHLVQRGGSGRGREHIGDGRTEPAAVLGREHDGQGEHVCELEEKHAVAQDALAARDRGEQLLLEIDDDQRRALGA